MLSNNVLTSFSVEESDSLSVSRQSGSNFSRHLMYDSLMEDRVTSLKDLCTVSETRFVEQIFINRICRR